MTEPTGTSAIFKAIGNAVWNQIPTDAAAAVTFAFLSDVLELARCGRLSNSMGQISDQFMERMNAKTGEQIAKKRIRVAEAIKQENEAFAARLDSATKAIEFTDQSELNELDRIHINAQAIDLAKESVADAVSKIRQSGGDVGIDADKLESFLQHVSKEQPLK